MAVNLSFIGGAGWQFLDNNGNVLSGGKIYTYIAGTTTPQATFTSRSGALANTNPIILDSAGRTPEQIWSTEGELYKYVVADSNDVTIRTWDYIGGSVVASDLAQNLANTTDNTKGDALVGFRQSKASGFLTGAVARTVNDKLQEIVSIMDFGAVPDGVTDNSDAINAALDYAGQNGGGAVYIPDGIFGITRIFIKYSNVTLYGNGPSSELKQVGLAPSSFAISPNGTSIFTNPNAAITIAPPNFVWGFDQTFDGSTVGTLSSIYLQNFKLTGWWDSAPPPYSGFNTNLTGQIYNDRSLGIISVCSNEIYYDKLNISQMGGENSYSWNARITNCSVIDGGELGSLGQYGCVNNCIVQSAYGQNGVSAREMTNNTIFSMPTSGLYFGGSTHTEGLIITNNYVFDCNGYALFGYDDGAITVAKQNVIINNNVFVGKTGMTQNAIAYIDFRAANTSVQIANNYITVPDNVNGLFLGPCQGEYLITNNIIKGPGVGVQNGIDLNNIGTNCFVAISENTVNGFFNKISPTASNAKISKGINYLGETVTNGALTLQAQTIDNLIVKQNIINSVFNDLATTTSYAPVADKGIKQCQFTGAGLTVSPPAGYQVGQYFILELLNASGGTQTVTMSAGTAPAAYKGSLTSGVSLNNAQRVIVQMVYITNTWLQMSIATL